MLGRPEAVGKRLLALGDTLRVVDKAAVGRIAVVVERPAVGRIAVAEQLVVGRLAAADIVDRPVAAPAAERPAVARPVAVHRAVGSLDSADNTAPGPPGFSCSSSYLFSSPWHIAVRVDFGNPEALDN